MKRLIDANAYAERIRTIMACWNCSPCLSPSEARRATDNLRVALNEISDMPTIERYKVYKIDSNSSYIGYSLVAANTAEEANQYIGSFREEDSDNKCDSWGYANVSEDDVLEHIFSDEPGIIDYGIRYFG